jgi:hypothetical protein
MNQRERRCGALAAALAALAVLLSGCGAQARPGAAQGGQPDQSAQVQLVSIANVALEQAAPLAASTSSELDQLRAADLADARRLAQITAIRQQVAESSGQTLAHATARHHCINS